MSSANCSDGSPPNGKSLRNKRPIRFLFDEIPAYLNGFGAKPRPGCIIFAQGRTGTWLLHSLLNQHPHLHFGKEVLQSPVFAPHRYVRGIAKAVSPALYGCHIQINQLINTQRLDPAGFLHKFASNGWKIIYLRRRDIVQQSISAILAVQRGIWVSRNPDAALQSPIVIDIPRVIARVKRRQLHLALEAEILASLDHLALTYEQYLQQPASHQQTADRIFDFLDVKSVPVTAATHPTTPNKLKCVIANYAPLMERISREFPDYV